MNVVVEGGEGGEKYNKLPNASNLEEKNENVQTIFCFDHIGYFICAIPVTYCCRKHVSGSNHVQN